MRRLASAPAGDRAGGHHRRGPAARLRGLPRHQVHRRSARRVPAPVPRPRGHRPLPRPDRQPPAHPAPGATGRHRRVGAAALHLVRPRGAGVVRERRRRQAGRHPDPAHRGRRVGRGRGHLGHQLHLPGPRQGPGPQRHARSRAARAGPGRGGHRPDDLPRPGVRGRHRHRHPRAARVLELVVQRPRRGRACSWSSSAPSSSRPGAARAAAPRSAPAGSWPASCGRCPTRLAQDRRVRRAGWLRPARPRRRRGHRPAVAHQLADVPDDRHPQPGHPRRLGQPPHGDERADLAGAGGLPRPRRGHRPPGHPPPRAAVPARHRRVRASLARRPRSPSACPRCASAASSSPSPR